MTNEEMIKALQQSLEPINKRLDAIEGNMATMQSNIETMQGSMATKEDITRIEDRMARLEVSYENEANRIVSLLKEDYSRVSAAAAKTWDYDEVKSTVKEHERALINHNQRIKELEDKAI